VKRSAILSLLVSLVGCSNILGIEGLHGPGSGSDGGTDATHTDGAGSDAISGPTITVSGKVFTIDANFNQVGVGGAAVDYVRLPDDVSVAQTTSDGSGHYSFAVPNNIMAYLRVKGDLATGQPDSLIYAVKPLTVDTVTDLPTYSRNAINTFASLGNAQQPQSTAFGIAIITTSANTLQANAQVQTQPTSMIRYTNNQGQPSPTLAQTGPNGEAMMFAMGQATTTITATLNGQPVASQHISVTTNNIYIVQLQVGLMP